MTHMNKNVLSCKHIHTSQSTYKPRNVQDAEESFAHETNISVILFENKAQCPRFTRLATSISNSSTIRSVSSMMSTYNSCLFVCMYHTTT
mmetsp:Transcript_6592/g.12427  ORF Transcript_6592/g.12427 Transcript_6592/m.12427 type:complete len:90 (-) Transcript_6592:5021-5290(-)